MFCAFFRQAGLHILSTDAACLIICMSFPSTEEILEEIPDTGVTYISLCVEEVSDKAVLSLMEAKNDPIFWVVRFIIALSSHFIVASSQAKPFLQSLEI